MVEDSAKKPRPDWSGASRIPGDGGHNMAHPPVDVVAQECTDRCDTCGARAYVIATMRTGLQVFYCAHHATKYWERLTAQAIRVDDQRWRLHVEDR